MIEVKREDGQLVGGGQCLSYDAARDLVDRIWAAIPAERAESGAPICPKCGIEATEDGPDFWVCEVIECDGYHQTVYEAE